MEYYVHANGSGSNDYDYRRKKAFQSISNGTVTNLMLLLDGVTDDVTKKLLISRSDRPITLRRPSTARNFQILNPTLLASACAEWYMEIVEFLASQQHGLSETVSVRDESNDIVQYDGVSPLCIATITGKFKMVQILVDHGTDLNQQNSIGNTSLFEACSEGHISIANYLIQKGANIELANHKRVTPLMIASYSNNHEIVKLLTDLGVNVNKKDKNDRNALFYCIASGSTQIFKLLRKSGAVLCNDQKGTTVLMEAAFYAQYDMVKWLMRNRDQIGLDSNAFDLKGRNALFYAAEAGNVEIFQILLSHGVSLHPALDGSTVYMVASLRGRHKIIDYFQENLAQLGLNLNTRDKRGRNCLFYCVSGGDVPLFGKLIDFGANVECAANGMNLLQQAAVRGDENFCKYFLDHSELDIDIQGRDQDGWSALFFAIASGNLQLFKTLHDSGVNTDPANGGRTLLMQAALRGNLEMIRHIVANQKDYQSDLNAQDSQGKSAVFFSLQSDPFQDSFKILSERGAKINKTKTGSTILMETAKVTKNIEVLKMIVKMGEKYEETDSEGRNALFYAAQNSNVAVLDYLLSLGIPLVTDVTDKTVLLTAVENGHLPLVELLIERHRELFLDLEHKDSVGRNALFYTIDSGKMDIFRVLIDAGVPCISDKSGVSVMMLLAGKDYKDFLEFVVTARNSLGIDILATDSNGDAAVHYAVKNKKYENLLLLIRNGGDLVASGSGESIISRCVEEGDFWVVESLATSGVDLSDDLNRKDQNGIPYFHHLLFSGINDALMIALLEMYYDETKDADDQGVTMAMKLVNENSLVLRHLVEGVCVNLNKTDTNGKNVLQHCAAANNLDNLKYFLAFGAKFQLDNDGKTALMECASKCPIETDCLNHLFKFIYRTDESRKIVDSKGRNVLHHSLFSENEACIAFVLEQGLDIEARDNEGMTPLLVAATRNSPSTVHQLADKGCDINARNNQSQTALHIHFESQGSTAIVTQALIGRGCDVNARDQSERTPLMLAAMKDNLRPIKFLLENGADASLVDSEGHDALSYCPEDHHIIRVLLTKHRDTTTRTSTNPVADAKLLTKHLLTQLPTPTQTETAEREDLARNLEPVVAGVVSRDPQAFDKLCNALKFANFSPDTFTSNCQEFYV